MKKACQHCGTIFEAGAATETFCCAGCAHVYALISNQGLDKFYQLRGGQVAPVSPAALLPRDYAWLVKLALEAEAKSTGNAAEFTLDLQGVACVGCIWLIEKLYTDKPGGLRIEVNAQLGRLWARWEKGKFDWESFARELQSFGYLLGPVGAAPAQEAKGLLGRMGLCAAFAMNAMGFALPRYLGMENTFALAGLFDLLSAVFATLAFIVGGSYFISRAWRGLLVGILPIDLPIALGVTGAYVGSILGWLLTGDGRFAYFDFVCTFMFLMLLGRWAQEATLERNRNRLLSRNARPQEVLVYTENSAAGTGAAVESVKPGTLFGLTSGAVCPVRSRLVEESASISLEWISGEADVHAWTRGRLLPAGAINAGRKEIRCEAMEPWETSLLAKLWAESTQTFRNLTLERVLKIYIITVLILATLTVPGWAIFAHDWAGGLQAALSLLVVSCPCALGIAYPLSTELAVARLRRVGLFVREESLWPRLMRVRRVLFDKTGTLTLESPALRSPEQLETLGTEARQALWALVSRNLHPVGRGLREALLPFPESATSADNYAVEEVVGHGVRWQSSTGKVWTLGKSGWLVKEKAIELPHPPTPPTAVVSQGNYDALLACDGVVIARFNLEEAIRTDARAEIAKLRKRGMEIHVLSGDRPEKVNALCMALDLPKSAGMGSMSPEEKAEWIQQHAPTDAIYIGDGANDSLAFEQALCRGTPVADRGLLENKADFYFLARGLNPIRHLLDTAALRQQATRRVFFFAICYNLIAGFLCIIGQMHPLLAAVLMPGSSLFTVFIVTGTYGERE
ncbi:MAG: heavy metal translocating P-type ATPase metal-binding domain-containing protein [Verrucomicrobiota bacterium]|nr:heavy metal translocating P-type ATPase metal-binding domain-containing protein [Verrucomicrobiota bacterium]